MKHVHCDLIKAWADGAKIQIKLVPSTEWEDVTNPSWSRFEQYRIKPTLRYRVALMQARDTPYILTEMDKCSSLEKSSSFVKWLTDWIEVEL